MSVEAQSEDTAERRPIVVVAGARGFVGNILLPNLIGSANVRALTRHEVPDKTEYEWRFCDLYSLLQTEQALEGADYAVYLVHSMLPSARLTQGSFKDFDLLAADNFARAAAMKGVRQIVYVSGMIPEDKNLSGHLASRKEVEGVLQRYGAAATVLRCAMIIGPGGSSLNILMRLVRRLPVMLCPGWTSTKSSPVHVDDIARAVLYTLGNEESFGRVYDVGPEEALSYREMMAEAAGQLGLRRVFIPIPAFSPKLSCAWVSLITGAPTSLLSPLVESLRHEMLPRPGFRLRLPGKPFRTFAEALSDVLKVEKPSDFQPRAFKRHKQKRPGTVRSVQRMQIPKGLRAPEIGRIYFKWLANWLAPILYVENDGDRSQIRTPLLPVALLELEYSDVRSTDDRALFYIRGGLLRRENERARMEFREAGNNKDLIVAIHDYRPSLPWYVYIWTQALVHLLVMRRFSKYLESLPEADPGPSD